MVYTGSSSLDIRLTLGQSHRSDPSITALVTFVARDPATGRATRVNPIVPHTDQEAQWFDERQEVARQRKAARNAVGGPGAAPAGGSAEATTRRAWAQRLLTEARAMRTMPGVPMHSCVRARVPGLPCQVNQAVLHAQPVRVYACSARTPPAYYLVHASMSSIRLYACPPCTPPACCCVCASMPTLTCQSESRRSVLPPNPLSVTYASSSRCVLCKAEEHSRVTADCLPLDAEPTLRVSLGLQGHVPRG